MPRTVCVLAAFLLCASRPGIATACECFVLPSCSTTWDADLVFVGTATSVFESRAGVTNTEFTVEEWLRGEQVGAKVVLRAEFVGVSCDYDFKPRGKYLVVAGRRADAWTASSCGGTGAFPSALAVVDEIREALRSRAPGVVSGTVSFDAFPDERVGGSVPIAGAAVTLRAGNGRISVTTDTKGAFRLARVPPGTYELIVDVPSNATPVPAQRLVVGANACITRVIFSDPRW